jgi:enamine deaminase RidA (YjgF/YER057c/UK114 family)
MPPVTIHSRNVAPDPTDPEGVKRALAVSYSTATRAPRTVYVSGESPTDEQVAAAIRQDLAAREAEPPSTLEV